MSEKHSNPSKSFGNLKVKSTKKESFLHKEKSREKVVGIDLKSSFWMTATCLQNLEQELADELTRLGAERVKVKNRAVEFKGDLKLLYKANIWLRTALKVLLPIASFPIHNEDDLYKKALNIEWENLIQSSSTFVIDSAIYSPNIKNTHFATLRLKDAIVDRFKENDKERPSISKGEPDLRIHLHIDHKVTTISLDSSGEPLFKRGYRQERHRAPINECLAAGMILKSGWSGEKPFLDPMTGSGTIAIEAALIASNIPPNLNRMRFGFEAWKSYDMDLFSTVLNDARSEYKPLRAAICAWEINSRSVRAARVNINAAQMRKSITLEQVDFLKQHAPEDEGVIIMNPPYGERLELKEGDLSFFEKIGSTLKHEFGGWEAWIISSDVEAFHKISLKPTKKIKLKNGKLDCEFRGYELFSGKRVDQLKSIKSDD